MRMQPRANINDPGVTPERFEEFTRPKGIYAYARAALFVAGSLLEKCIDGLAEDLGEKPIPTVDIECPAPPLFNAFHKSGWSLQFNADSLTKAADSGNAYEYFKQHGDISQGDIWTSDAVSETYLALGWTREYFRNLLTSSRVLGPDVQQLSRKIPRKIIKETDGLIRKWDAWRPGGTLDLSSAPNLPHLSADAEVDQVLDRPSIMDWTLVDLLLIVLSHEYGHMLRSSDAGLQKKMNQKGEAVLNFFIAGGPADFGFELDRYADILQRDKSVFSAWQEEISCDIAGLDLCLQACTAYFGDNEETLSQVLNSLATLCLMLCLIEVFQMRKYGKIGASHPVSFVRYYLDMIYVTTAIGWNYVDRWPFMVNGITGIRSIQSRLLSV